MGLYENRLGGVWSRKTDGEFGSSLSFKHFKKGKNSVTILAELEI